jgi:hypothetical protein
MMCRGARRGERLQSFVGDGHRPPLQSGLMRKVLWLVLIALVAALAVWYGRRVAEKSATVAVVSLLPAETLLVVHLPDFNRTRDQWHRTDVYQIRQEPAVNDFLQKPLSRIPKRATASQNLVEFEKLEPKDIFFAVTSWTSGLKVAGGFRFKGKADDAEKIVAQWRARLLARSPETKTEAIEYEKHQIQTVTAMGQMLASVYDNDWFFVTNDVAELKTIIDRFEGRLHDRATTLATDASFSAAFKHIPSSYAAMIYGRLDRYFEKMMPLLGTSGASTAANPPVYRQIHAFCGALSFDGGKIRDVLFLGMPQLVDVGPLTRSSLAFGTKETFFYLASFLNLPNQMSWPAAAPAAAAFPGMIQKFAGAIANSGVTMEAWNAAFGPELGVLGDWPGGGQWPAFLASVPVKDQAKAGELFTKMTSTPTGESTAQERDGVRYFSAPSEGRPFSVAPTLALSNKVLIAGTSESTVETAMKRSAGGASELASSETFRAAERAVPPAKQAFFYVDSALLYTRLDAVLRPMLVMSAAFIPSISENIDLTKFPPAEAITRHLSPIVMSQNYQSDGYVTESVGPVTFYEATVGAVLLGGGATMLYRQPGALSNILPSLSPSPSAGSPMPSPSSAPSGTP